MSSTEGDREYRALEEAAISGGKEVWRSGCDEAEVVESIEALRRLVEGAEVGMSVCRRLGGWGRSCGGGESAEL